MIDLLALSLLPIWRWRGIAAQLRVGQSAGHILEQHCSEAASGHRTRTSAASLRARAAAALERAASSGLRAIACNEPAYPAALAAIVDPPPVLWVRGNPPALDPPAVAIVGSRGGSSYALAVAERLASDLAVCGIVVVSGLARGVDSAAHRGALSAGGRTVAVLGCGADVVYPGEHRALAVEIAATGALVSELVPGTPPHPRFFPQRNRIISGLTRAVVVVEAGERSGSLITARCALDQGRDVMAVPGNVLSGRNRGGHALLRDGARIVEGVDDVLEELGLAAAEGRPHRDPGAASASGGNESPVSDPVLACLTPGESSDLDGIARRSGLPPARLLTRLLELELQGLVGRVGSGRFVRFDRSC